MAIKLYGLSDVKDTRHPKKFEMMEDMLGY